jgi:hypothetical protein
VRKKLNAARAQLHPVEQKVLRRFESIAKLPTAYNQAVSLAQRRSTLRRVVRRVLQPLHDEQNIIERLVNEFRESWGHVFPEGLVPGIASMPPPLSPPDDVAAKFVEEHVMDSEGQDTFLLLEHVKQFLEIPMQENPLAAAFQRAQQEGDMQRQRAEAAEVTAKNLSDRFALLANELEQCEAMSREKTAIIDSLRSRLGEQGSAHGADINRLRETVRDLETHVDNLTRENVAKRGELEQLRCEHDELQSTITAVTLRKDDEIRDLTEQLRGLELASAFGDDPDRFCNLICRELARHGPFVFNLTSRNFEAVWQPPSAISRALAQPTLTLRLSPESTRSGGGSLSVVEVLKMEGDPPNLLIVNACH